MDPDPALTDQRRSLLDQAEGPPATPQQMIEMCRQVLLRSREELGELEFCRAHYQLGFGNRLIGELSSAESELFFAKQLATAIDAKELIAHSTMQLGLLYIDEQHNDRALELLKQAVAQFAALHLILEEGRANFALSTVYRQMGLHTEALAALEESLIKFSDVGSEAGVTAVHFALVHVAMDRGNFQEAIERAELCLKVLPDTSLPKNRIWMHVVLAECCRRLNQADRALEIIASAIESSGREGYPLHEARALIIQHHVYRDLGETELARFSLEKAEELANLHGFVTAFEALKQEHSI